MQTCVGKGPSLIISHYFPSSFSMYLLCGALPILTKAKWEKKRKILLWVMCFSNTVSTTLSSTGVHLLSKIIPAACNVKHRKPAAAAAFSVANSGGHGCTSRGERQGEDMPIYLCAHIKKIYPLISRLYKS